MQSTAPTVAKYLLELPPDRRPAIEAVRRVILQSVDKDIEETMSYGSIGYVIPHRVFPGGYHCDPRLPVPYIGLASQKNHMAVYLMFAYTGGHEENWIRQAYAAKGKRLDMGACCLRFRKLEDIDLGILAESIRRVPAQQYIATYVATVGADKWKRGAAAEKKRSEKKGEGKSEREREKKAKKKGKKPRARKPAKKALRPAAKKKAAKARRPASRAARPTRKAPARRSRRA